MKKKYDSSVIFLYSTGNEHLLPAEFRKKIPYSTISTWRKTKFEKYIGNEFRYFFDDALKLSRLINENRKQRKTLYSIAKSWLILKEYIQPELKIKSKEIKVKRQIISVVFRMKNQLGLNATLKLLGISHSQYNQWILEIRFNCFDSYTELCMKNHPQQLGNKEIQKIKNILTDPEWSHWPVTSLASKALRDKTVIASTDSWYKYAKIFGIRRKLEKKFRKRIGLIATMPNEYLHCDLTIFPLANGKKVYITFVMDNYSKMILGYHVRTDKTFRGVIGALKMALTPMENQGAFIFTQLETDGGSENINSKVHDFLK